MSSGYEVILPHSRIVLSFGSPPADPDYYILELQNAERETVGAWEVTDPGDPSYRTTDADWILVNDLYTCAHRTAAGWDAVLSDVNAALQRPGTVGVKVGNRDDADGDNIPF